MAANRGRPRSVLAAAILAVSLTGGGRADVPPIPESGPVNARPVLPSPETAKSEFERYLKEARRLKTYHDGGILQEADVFRVLATEGVLPSLGAEFRPFHVPVFEGKWRWPLRAGIVSSRFGPRWGRSHEGIDIAADQGVPVMAAAKGRVIYAGNGLRGYGNVVILRHDQNTTTLYAHNQALKVRAGQDVDRGKVIALLGSTGRSTGPHVHFEIRVKRKAVDPRKILPKSRTIRA